MPLTMMQIRHPSHHVSERSGLETIASGRALTAFRVSTKEPGVSDSSTQGSAIQLSMTRCIQSQISLRLHSVVVHLAHYMHTRPSSLNEISTTPTHGHPSPGVDSSTKSSVKEKSLAQLALGPSLQISRPLEIRLMSLKIVFDTANTLTKIPRTVVAVSASIPPQVRSVTCTVLSLVRVHRLESMVAGSLEVLTSTTMRRIDLPDL